MKFSVYQPYIVGSYSVSDYFSFTIYADEAPQEGDIILIDGVQYEVESVTDDTSQEEEDEGISFSKVQIIKR